MKKIIIIVVVLAVIGGVLWWQKGEKEKAIFGGKRRSDVLKILRSKWKPIYIEGQTSWILNGTENEIKDVQAKADENNVSLEEQASLDANWLFDNVPENKHPYRFDLADSGKGWRKRWVISQVEGMNIDTTLQAVQDMMYKV